jgi:hypothetical protein
LVAVAPDLRLRLRFAKPRYQLIAKATYLAKPRYQLIAKATYLAKPRFCSPVLVWLQAPSSTLRAL